MIEHVVVLRLRADHEPEELAAVIAGLSDLVGRLPGALRFAGGPNRDYEGLSKGWDAGFAISFADAAALDHYAQHPEHKALAARLVALCAGGVQGLMVFDFESPG